MDLNGTPALHVRSRVRSLKLLPQGEDTKRVEKQKQEQENKAWVNPGETAEVTVHFLTILHVSKSSASAADLFTSFWAPSSSVTLKVTVNTPPAA